MFCPPELLWGRDSAIRACPETEVSGQALTPFRVFALPQKKRLRYYASRVSIFFKEALMKKLLGMYARYIRQTNAAVVSLLNGLSVQEREKDRGSYYKSLSGLARHILGGELYFYSLFIPALPAKSKARKALEAAKGITVADKKLSAAGWSALAEQFAAADAALVNFADSLEEGELELPVKLGWYGGKPDAVPLCFLFNQLVMHVVHHQGQISQIFDEMKIEHDFSAIDVKFLP
jgi:uncharacterized damage-inducible protein DinB